ncbi:AAA domain-containing protein [Pedobacter agri]|uniref:AAA domain-containing protein n=1 Tax=Pedobacter agri TaxID=454586 RepID=UPI0029317680|nr:AAA domain-containing protein [Pedobacter agri]
MQLTNKLITELQKRLKVGNRRGVHLDGVPGSSRYKFDLHRLTYIDQNLPANFISALMSEAAMRFKISWKNNVPDLNSLFEEDQTQLVRITKSFENLINQTDAIESEKGINTFGFGFPLLIRRDQADNKLTLAPVFIWSLRVKRTKEFNTWEIIRTEEDPVYVNEVLINHLASDSHIEIPAIPGEMLEEGFLSRADFLSICQGLLSSVNTTTGPELSKDLSAKLSNPVAIKDKKHYESLPITSTNAALEFGGLFSIFEIQKQNIIEDYDAMLAGAETHLDQSPLVDGKFQPISSVETDPSQQSILNGLSVKRNVVIQGPPGTGKSQSLTALLVNALENKLKTIVVCEKRTALEVLKDALDEKRLHFHSILIKDIVKDRRTVVDSVRDRVDSPAYRSYHYSHSRDSLDELISELQSMIGSINTQHQKLDVPLLSGYNWTAVVGMLLKELDAGDESALALEGRSFKFDSTEMNELVSMIQKGEKLYRSYQPVAALSFLKPDKLTGENLYAIEQHIHRDFQGYAEQHKSIAELTQNYRTAYRRQREAEFSRQLEQVQQLNILQSDIDQLQVRTAAFKQVVFSRQSAEMEQEFISLRESVQQLRSTLSPMLEDPDFQDEEKTAGLGFKIANLFSGKSKRLEAQRTAIRSLFSALNEKIQSGDYLKPFIFAAGLKTAISEIDTLIQLIEVKSASKAEDIEEYFTGLNLFDAAAEKFSDPASTALEELTASLKERLPAAVHQNNLAAAFSAQVLKTLSAAKDLYISSSTTDAAQLLGSINTGELREKFDTAVETEFAALNPAAVHQDTYQLGFAAQILGALESFIRSLESDGWLKKLLHTDQSEQFLAEIHHILGEKAQYFNHAQDPFTLEFNWYKFYNSLTDENRLLLNALAGQRDWKKSFLAHYLNALLIANGTAELPVNDEEHGAFADKIKGYEKEQLRFINQYWYSRQINQTRDFERSHPDLSIENLYNKRSSPRFKRLSLRKIVKYDLDLFSTFFPIILTTPDVASNLFKGNNGYFDLVVFDEASQLRLEDNLPAILKGKQVIIAGDEHQMPPSNFFSKVFDGSIEDEEDLEDEEKPVFDHDNLLLSCESLLDFATELNFDKKYLDFHYRSRHPELIDFSNHAFYNQRLKPLPNSFEYLPIKYIQVGGTFSEHTNEQEADMVLSVLEHNIHRLPDGKYPSVGVATFNIAQRNLIKSRILERAKFSRFEHFNRKMTELEESGFFVKNLENIQGDERDVIILSTTYGVNKEGKFKQVFGPVNHSSGYKLLNVIITRAKYKIYVCSSIPEEVFLNYRDHLLAEGANNKKAIFYAYLAYAKAVSESDSELRNAVFEALNANTNAGRPPDNRHDLLESPFEEEVYDALLDHFDASQLIPQFQFAGFRLDIVYDSGLPGIPKVAIECDGAKYHSSEEAYLHDLYRQRIMENQGFIFHRIWSTNWWRNPKRELSRLVSFINALTDETAQGSAQTHPLSAVFSHQQPPQSSPVNPGESLALFDDEPGSPDEPTEMQSPPDRVELNDQVKIKYLNSDKDFTVQIIQGKGSLAEIGALQKISIESPLSRAILGAGSGDIVKIGTLDNFVEILEINKNHDKTKP